MIKKLGILFGCFSIVIGISAMSAKTQKEEKPQNLKVLPKNISPEALEATMKAFNATLGVKCSYCHTPKTTGERGLDFASDANPKKEVAREMLKMTAQINKKHFKHYEKDGVRMQIGCGTCHNGKAEPTMRILD